MSVFDFVTQRLATGGEIRTAADAAALLDSGVTHVLNCADNANGDVLMAVVKERNVELCYLSNPVDDCEPRQHKPPRWFEKSLDFALPALTIAGTKLYVNCAEGLNRGPSTAYAILRALGLAPATAEALIRAARPQVELQYMRDADAAVHALGYADAYVAPAAATTMNAQAAVASARGRWFDGRH